MGDDIESQVIATRQALQHGAKGLDLVEISLTLIHQYVVL